MVRFASASLLALAALCTGCADPAPPAPDPARIDRLVASMEKRHTPEPNARARMEKKLQSADRLAGTLVKVQPEKIDPEVVAALIAR